MSIFKKILTGFNFVGNSIKNAKLIEVCAEVVTELPSEESSEVGRYVYYNGDLWCYDGSHWDKVQTEIKQVQLSDGTVGSISDGIITVPAISGIKGPTGARGAQGYRGVQGYQGTQGSQGLQGPQGDKGPQGDPGPGGGGDSIGSTGPQGPQGYQGSSGSGDPLYYCDTAPDISIKRLSLVYGEEPRALYNGLRISVRFLYENIVPDPAINYQGNPFPILLSEGNPPMKSYSWLPGSVVDLVLINGVWFMTSPSMPLPGPAGPQGYQGNRGFQGYQGYQGDTGAQGHEGAQGNQGNQGHTGPQGYQGYRGFQGLPAESITWNLIQSLFKAHGITLEEGKISAVNGFYQQ